MTSTFSLYQIKTNQYFDFDLNSYSKFKFGDSTYAEEFGRELARKFILHRQDVFESSQEIVVLSYIYRSISTASSGLAGYFTKELNRYLKLSNHNIAKEGKIIRENTYETDYGYLDDRGRKNLIKDEPFYIDANNLKGKYLIIVDDAKITGTHQERIEKFLNNLDLDEHIVFAYFAEIKSNIIHPAIENYINYFAISRLSDLLPLSKSKSFKFNARVVKFILGSIEDELQNFLSSHEYSFLEEIYDLALSNNYHCLNKLKHGINVLERLLKSRANIAPVQTKEFS